jgi:hypothetical protein
LIGREQQRDVDRHARENGFLDRRQAFLGARNLDEQVRLAGARVQILGGRERAGRVVRQQRRHFQRDEPVDAIGPVVNLAEQAGGAREIFHRQVEEEFFARLSSLYLFVGLPNRNPGCS